VLDGFDRLDAGHRPDGMKSEEPQTGVSAPIDESTQPVLEKGERAA